MDALGWFFHSGRDGKERVGLCLIQNQESQDIESPYIIERSESARNLGGKKGDFK